MSCAVLAVVPLMPERIQYLPGLTESLSAHGLRVEIVRHIDGTPPLGRPPESLPGYV